MTIKITVAKRNGVEELHRPGCADLKKKKGWASDRSDWIINVETLKDLYRSYWECIDTEAVADGAYPDVEHAWWAWRGEFKLMPCAGDVPEMDDPDAAPAVSGTGPRAYGTRGGNQELARWLVDLVAANAGALDDRQAQKVANWLKHLPTGGEGAGPLRYWPESLTRPDTADWR